MNVTRRLDDGQPMLRILHSWRDRLDRVRHDLLYGDIHCLQLQPIRRDTTHVHQVVDQPHQLRHLPPDDRAGMLRRRRYHVRKREQGEAAADRCECVPKLVRQRGQKLVLPTVGLLQCLLTALQ